jgi:hypothetical protein
MSHVSQSDDPIQRIVFSGQTTGLAGFGEDVTRMDNLAVGGCGAAGVRKSTSGQLCSI